MKKLILILLILFIAVPTGTAFALPEEEVIDREISTSYYDIWKHSNGTWQVTGRPGGWYSALANATFRAERLSALGEDWTITRIKATGDIDSDKYKDAGGWWGSDWKRYRDDFYQFRPKTQYTVQYSVADFLESQLIEAHGLTAEALLDDDLRQAILTYFKGETIPVWLIEMWDSNELRSYAVDITHQDKRQKYGLPPQTFSDNVEGWRVFLPALITWYGVPIDKPNLLIGEFKPGVDQPVVGQKYTAVVEFINDSDMELSNLPVAVYNNGYQATLTHAGTTVSTIDLGPGETKTCNFQYTALEGGNTLKAVIDTPPLPNTVQETSEEDNTAEIDIFAQTPPTPPGPGQLTLQATSKGGDDIYGNYNPPQKRTLNTAKWTDDVVATLKPPKPNAPRGHITSWHITSAKITIPQKNPDFIFTNPLPPSGTRTLNMIPNGHEATANFEQLWAIDGYGYGTSAAGVYSQIEGRVMSAIPKKYPITAQYNISFEYEWEERRRSCHRTSSGDRRCHTYYVTKTGSGSTSGNASGELLVNGAGQVPLAN